MAKTKNFMTQAEFGRHMGYKSRSRVTQLKDDGRLVFNADGLIDVEASIIRIQETADPNRDDVRSRHEANREPAPQPEMEKAGKGKEGTSSLFQKARAEKEMYQALTAKADYEKMIGNLVSKDDMKAAVSDVVTTFRQGLENLPHRISAELVGKDINEIRITLKQAIQHELANMERNFTEKLSQPSELAA